MGNPKTVLGGRLNRDEETGAYVAMGTEVCLEPVARSRGVYVIGSTGTGKTTFLQTIAIQDMLAGHGLCVLDPHGDMIDFLLNRIPEHREEDVILFNPADIERPYGLNLLECDRTDAQAVRWVVSTLLTTLQRLFSTSWGPRLEHVLSHALWTAMTIPHSTLVEVLLLLTDFEFRQKHTSNLTEPLLNNFWQEFPKSPRDRDEFVSSTINKLTPFLLDGGIRNIIGQPQSTLNIREVMDSGKILLVNLSKGDIGENNSSLLGSVLVNLILMAALSRRDMPLAEREKRQFHLIVDEYQNFASESFSVLQSEARKYAVDLMVAHQYRDQLDILNRGAALNVGNFVCFRTTGIDSTELAMQFDNTPPEPEPRYEPIRRQSANFPGIYMRENVEQVVDGPRRMYTDVAAERANALANLPPFHAQVKLIQQKREGVGLELAEGVIQALNPDDEALVGWLGAPNWERAERIIARSREYAPVRAAVEREFNERTDNRASFVIPPASNVG